MSDLNKELVRRHFDEILNRRNLAACDDLMAHDYIEHAVAPFGQTEPGRVAGPEHMRSVVEWLTAQFPDISFRIDALIADGDLVAARVYSEGTNQGPLGPIPPTGKRFGASSTHWFRIADGKLAEHWATRDDLTTMLQLGVLQPTGGGPSHG